MELSFYILNNIQYFLVVFVRMLGIFILTPLFGTKTLPAMFKIGLAFFTSIILFDLVKINIDVNNLYQYFILVFNEFLIGLLIGLASMISFSAIYLAGQLIDYQLGFGIVNILDVEKETQVPLMGNFIYILTLLLFLLIDGHHKIFIMLAQSYNMIPAGSAVLQFDNINAVITKIVTDMFALGFRISAPIVLSTLLSDLTLSIISRTIPQLNVFMVGMPLKIFVGIFTMFIMLPMYLAIIDVLFNGMYSDIFLLLKSMLKG
ncbi:flagellar biosynthetic protein FliR [Thermoanaerobacterium sp. RBIITD]|uniref:flagellar biosynthetic protein FliR n=1 Tax=Thermoanaerobacterium sp. RBIITD TaxID=1550240 RepID=UPI000BB6FA1D|nr:flagellar biosynthetic protein FliR [Thermoanaerobacterium sp. RBIITD]SNX55503.1 flagellar biosynthetic protein FliR [Thermoanaerobacterium sp. RBIITD]